MILPLDRMRADQFASVRTSRRSRKHCWKKAAECRQHGMLRAQPWEQLHAYARRHDAASL